MISSYRATVLPNGQLSWWLWLLWGAIGVHVQETLYRMHAFETYLSWEAQAVLWPLYLGCGPGFFWGFRRAPSFLAAWATFITFVVISRIMINFYVHEPFNGTVVCGLALLVYGVYATMQAETKFLQTALGIGMGCLGIFVGGSALTTLLPSVSTPQWWMAYLLVAALIIAVIEYIYRRGHYDRYFSWHNLRVVVPLDFVCCAGLFYGYSLAQPSFMFGWAMYTLFDVIVRIGNNRLLGEPFRLVHALGMALVVEGTFLTYAGASH